MILINITNQTPVNNSDANVLFIFVMEYIVTYSVIEATLNEV